MYNFDKLKKEQKLFKEGALKLHNPQWEAIGQKIAQMRIFTDMVLPDKKHLLNINGINCFPRGDLVAISGKEKCGKTTDCRIIVSALMKGEYMGVKAVERQQDARVLWIDTEQARQTSRAVCRGIELMCGHVPPPDRFIYFALREYPDRQEMTEVMRMLFDEYRPDIAIIDGIRDFIPDFNDVVESAEIVLECMRLSSGVDAETARKKGLNERPPCCVCCILHQNKPKDDNNMRGHLGTELSNKAGEVWEATQDDDHVFTFQQTRSRTRPVDDPLRYKVLTVIYNDHDGGKSEEIGMPELWSVEPAAGAASANSATAAVGAASANSATAAAAAPSASSTRLHPPVRYIRTSKGWYPMDQNTAFFMFWTVMGKSGWEFNELKQAFTSYWGVDHFVFNDLVKLTDHHVYRVIENGRKLWLYNGPRPDPENPENPEVECET